MTSRSAVLIKRQVGLKGDKEGDRFCLGNQMKMDQFEIHIVRSPLGSFCCLQKIGRFLFRH